jgi:hypothetical protein
MGSPPKKGEKRKRKRKRKQPAINPGQSAVKGRKKIKKPWY